MSQEILEARALASWVATKVSFSAKTQMRVLSDVILPLVSLGIGLHTWRLAYKRGWRKILPIFSYYIAFYCVTFALLLALTY